MLDVIKKAYALWQKKENPWNDHTSTTVFHGSTHVYALQAPNVAMLVLMPLCTCHPAHLAPSKSCHQMQPTCMTMLSYDHHVMHSTTMFMHVSELTSLCAHCHMHRVYSCSFMHHTLLLKFKHLY